jgi:hypothetical protein
VDNSHRLGMNQTRHGEFGYSGHIYQASSKAGVPSRSELSTLVRQFNGV